MSSSEIWNRVNNIISSSYCKSLTTNEAETLLEIQELKNEETKISTAETVLKLDLIDAYTQRVKKIKKLEKFLDLADELKDNKKLRSDIRDILLTGNEKFTLSSKRTVVPN
ncbi:hypothetical protein TVAG_062920 [Trichomonas vaginalis G3]|uniref:Uncharacterized protein n=1 Tax=Trichomonas vaginalis (strain ATCC PRA-98 / G3) TaxID=412133 RepID=A2DLQ4_TRIV3|nr:hypothetical protein TVAGG3_0581070 [Trichomonas vaginalis G3]EAY18687.1 hypothetical protein TVAG_062920 [Trichomonas vaginalis G3]KAI5522586.1 hypothetical protein TVAGG3_0581070 [Trichomonas vaginalis G3]|eukprot:XP_001579673.1 hypothetical protein [Trichomonas vaginalis G3]